MDIRIAKLCRCINDDDDDNEGIACMHAIHSTNLPTISGVTKEPVYLRLGCFDLI